MVVVVVGPGSAAVGAVAAGSPVVVIVVVVASGTSGAGVAISGATGASGAAGKRSARVVGRQAAWAGATATTETKAAQAKKSVVTRFLKVVSGYPAASGVGRPFHRPLSAAEPLPQPGIRQTPSGRSQLSGRGSTPGQGQIQVFSGAVGSRIRPLPR
jgi:hypothetical protein